MSGGSQEAGRSVTSKLCAVLAAFDADNDELTIAAIGRRSGLPATTARRLVAQLAEQKLLEPVVGGRFRVGLLLWRIGSHAVRRNALRAATIPEMRDLFNATGENVQLAVVDERQALYIERITGPKSVPSRAIVGSRWPLHATGAGKALLAHMTPLPTGYESSLPKLTVRTISEPSVLRAALTQIRRTGVAFAFGEDENGTIAVAAPVLGPNDAPIASIAVIGHWRPAVMRKVVPLIRESAYRISRAVHSEPSKDVS